ncbi:hypothetical protein YC2023_058932 [Brassica napus]
MEAEKRISKSTSSLTLGVVSPTLDVVFHPRHHHLRRNSYPLPLSLPQWSSKESLQWEFNVDTNKNAFFIYIEEDLQYKYLMKIVSEDFSIKEEKISLSYGISLDFKSIVEGFPPISIGNTR